MNYIRHLTGFFDRVVPDERLNPTHISLYIALFQYWNVNRFHNPISISRSEIMKVSKISAKGTYHKCMKQLHEFGYIRYDPSYNPFRGSLVHLMNFDETETVEKNTNKHQAKKRTGSGQVVNTRKSGSEQALIPSLNNSNVTNSLNNREASATIKMKMLNRSDGKKKEKSSVQKERKPLLQQVEEFFKANTYPLLEAKKFFNHYKAIGWKLSGAPIQDWRALAEKWMINAASFNAGKKNNSEQLHTEKEKNYGEPL